MPNTNPSPALLVDGITRVRRHVGGREHTDRWEAKSRAQRVGLLLQQFVSEPAEEP